MSQVRVAFLPSMLDPAMLQGQAVAFFDVLRATTSLAVAVRNDARVTLFTSLDEIRAAATDVSVLKAGELNAVRPDDFDLGNSPAAFSEPGCADAQIYFSTTNGTRAAHTCQFADRLFAGALVNATATAAALAGTGLPITLVCSGTQGTISLEDVLGCGAVIERLIGYTPANDEALLAVAAWQQVFEVPSRLVAMHASFGGRNIVAAGLADDIAFAAQLDSIDVAVEVTNIDGRMVATKARG